MPSSHSPELHHYHNHHYTIITIISIATPIANDGTANATAPESVLVVVVLVEVVEVVVDELLVEEAEPEYDIWVEDTLRVVVRLLAQSELKENTNVAGVPKHEQVA